MIKDSGERQQFESGCVRDASTGKAQWHLFPPCVWASIGGEEVDAGLSAVAIHIAHFLTTGNKEYLSGAVAHGFNLVSHERVAEHLRAGAEKYDPYNWVKGMPVSRCLDSLGRHMHAMELGQDDEDHGAAMMCNLIFILTYLQLKPGLNDMPVYWELANGLSE